MNTSGYVVWELGNFKENTNGNATQKVDTYIVEHMEKPKCMRAYAFDRYKHIMTSQYVGNITFS